MPQLVKPSPGNRTQAFGPYHYAVDYGWGNGATVYAAAAGPVDVSWSDGYGWTVEISHGRLINGKVTVTRYRHLSSSGLPRDSSQIAQGAPIAIQGNTGYFALNKEGVPQRHLHFELLLDGVKTDPERFYGTTADTPAPVPTLGVKNMRIIRHPNGTITAVGETTFQHYTNIDQYISDADVWGPYVDVAEGRYGQIVNNTMIRKAYSKTGDGTAAGSTVNEAAIAAKVEAALLDDFARLATATAQLNSKLDALEQPTRPPGPTLAQITGALAPLFT